MRSNKDKQNYLTNRGLWLILQEDLINIHTLDQQKLGLKTGSKVQNILDAKLLILK
jgi:hypothetical protein